MEGFLYELAVMKYITDQDAANYRFFCDNDALDPSRYQDPYPRWKLRRDPLQWISRPLQYREQSTRPMCPGDPPCMEYEDPKNGVVMGSEVGCNDPDVEAVTYLSDTWAGDILPPRRFGDFTPLPQNRATLTVRNSDAALP